MSLDVMNLLLVLLAALAGGALARRVGYPAILGELMAGIVLGPPLLGLIEPDDALAVIGKLGVVLLMLYIGLHLDPTDIGRAAKPAALAAAGGFIVPASLGFGLMLLAGSDVVAAIFVAVAMGVTSLATKSRILVDLGILNTRIAHVLMAGALFSDIAALVVFAAVLGLAATGAVAVGGIVAAIAKAVLFLAGAWVVGTRVFPVIGRRLRRRSTDTGIVFLLVVIAALGFGAAADAAGLHAILGAFLAGLFIRDSILTREQLSGVEARAFSVSVGLLAPVFFVSAGFDVSFGVFTDAPLLLAAVVIVATVGKVVGTALFYLPTGYGFREGIAVGAGMNGRGAVEIIVAELALTAGLIDATVFSILVFMAIFTTATVPVLLTKAIGWLRRRGELAEEERDAIVIVGAGPVARRIARLLATSSPVALIDTNADHCRAASDAGLHVHYGSGLDEETLADAGAAQAGTLIAATANAEVNVLAATLGRTRFGIPSVHVALPGTTTSSVFSMLEEIGGELLFSRAVDVASWDADLDLDRVTELSYAVADPEDALTHGAAVDPGRARVTSLPLVVEGADAVRLFSSHAALQEGDRVIALGRDEHVPSSVELPGLSTD
jgi:Kef-type K+ transport system membrane component KefB